MGNSGIITMSMQLDNFNGQYIELDDSSGRLAVVDVNRIKSITHDFLTNECQIDMDYGTTYYRVTDESLWELERSKAAIMLRVNGLTLPRKVV